MSEQSRIKLVDGKLLVPDNPTIPFIIGDGTGPDIWRPTRLVIDAAIRKAYGDTRRLNWLEVYAGDLAVEKFQNPLPDDTTEAIAKYLVAIKGPLATPIGHGIRSLNVAIRQRLRLFACVRPVRYIPGVPSPVRHPEDVDMDIFRENCEDIYAGIEWEQGTDDCARLLEILMQEFPERARKLAFPNTSAFGLKPVSVDGTQRLVRAAINHAIKHKKASVTLVHKGNIMKSTEGAFMRWAYELARDEFGAVPYQRDDDEIGFGKWWVIKLDDGHEIIIKDVIADAMLQQVLLRPKEYDVIATMNLNGDYISDALAAQVGGIGIAPGANINYDTGVAVFEATHGTAPKYTGLDQVNPCSEILSGEMMLRYIEWDEAADYLINGVKAAIAARKVTYDFHRLMEGEGAEKVSCSGFGEVVAGFIEAA